MNQIFILVSVVLIAPSLSCWTDWTYEGNCTLPCGGGHKILVRSCPCGDCKGPTTRTSSELCNQQSCCVWGNWSDWGNCSATCGGGVRNRTRSCVCQDPGNSRNHSTCDGDDMDFKTSRKRSRRFLSRTFGDDEDQKRQWIEFGECNTQNCCQWVLGNWSDCIGNDCFAVKVRPYVCNCVPPPSNSTRGDDDDDHSTPTSTPTSKGDGDDQKSSRNFTYPPGYGFCDSPKPTDETEKCVGPQCCRWGTMSNWTQCKGGKTYSRQLCVCGNESPCNSNYNDSLCVGTPYVEVKNCSVQCDWRDYGEWSNCNACCDGKKWRPKRCYCDDQQTDDSNCPSIPNPFSETTDGCHPCCPLSESTSSCPVSYTDNANKCYLKYKTAECGCETYCPPDPYPIPTPIYEELPIDTCKYSNPLSICSITGEISPGESKYDTTMNCAFNFRLDVSAINSQLCYPKPQCSNCTTSLGNTDNCEDHNGTYYYKYTTYEIEGNPTTYMYDLKCGATTEIPDCWSWSSWTECCGNCTDRGSQWRIQKPNNTSCYALPKFENRTCDVSFGKQNGECCVWQSNNMRNVGYCNDQNKVYQLPTCSCPNELNCVDAPIPQEGDCIIGEFYWDQDTNSSCNSSCSDSGVLWTSQKCGNGKSFSACDISKCYGVPSLSSEQCNSGRCCTWRNTSSCTVTTANCTKSKGDAKDSKSGDCYDSKGKNKTNTPSNISTTTIFCELITTRECYCSGTNGTVDPSYCNPTLPLIEIAQCPFNCCSWSPWSDWTECSSNCTQKRYHSCICVGDNYDSKKVNLKVDPKENHQYSPECNGSYFDDRKCESCVKPKTVEGWKTSGNLENEPKYSNCPNKNKNRAEILEKQDSTWDILASEYIAATLNIDAGVKTNKEAIQKVLDETRILLDKCEWNDNQRDTAKMNIELLRKFNSGIVVDSLTSEWDKNYYVDSSSRAEGNSGELSPGGIAAIVVVVSLVVLVAIGLTIRYRRRKYHRRVILPDDDN